jgi:hypothetical protein
MAACDFIRLIKHAQHKGPRCRGLKARRQKLCSIFVCRLGGSALHKMTYHLICHRLTGVVHYEWTIRATLKGWQVINLATVCDLAKRAPSSSCMKCTGLPVVNCTNCALLEKGTVIEM